MPENTSKTRKSLLPLLILVACVAAMFLPWGRWFGPAKPPPAQATEKLAIARRLIAQNRHDALIRLGSTVTPQSAEAPEIFTLVGQSFLARGDVANARKALEASLELKLEQPEALEYLAAIYLASGDAVRGLALLELVARLKPDDFRPWLAMGKVRQDLGESAEAALAYDECLKRNPPVAEARAARVGRIRALINETRTDEVEVVVAESMKSHPEDAEILGLAALSAQSAGRPDDAKNLASTSLRFNPDEADALLALAQASFLEADAGTAETLLKKADRVKPNQTAVLQLLMQAQARQGKNDEASQTKARFQALTQRKALMDKLSKSISSQPDDPRPRYELGLAALEGDMKVLAEQCFRAALDVDPGFSEAREALDKMTREK